MTVNHALFESSFFSVHVVSLSSRFKLTSQARPWRCAIEFTPPAQVSKKCYLAIKICFGFYTTESLTKYSSRHHYVAEEIEVGKMKK